MQFRFIKRDYHFEKKHFSLESSDEGKKQDLSHEKVAFITRENLESAMRVQKNDQQKHPPH